MIEDGRPTFKKLPGSKKLNTQALPYMFEGLPKAYSYICQVSAKECIEILKAIKKNKIR
jgi:hypothetical protein